MEMAIVQVGNNWRPSAPSKRNRQAITKPRCVGSVLLLAIMMYNIYVLHVRLNTTTSRTEIMLVKDATENSPKDYPSEDDGPLSVVNHSHGKFLFWQDSHQVRIPIHDTIEQSLTDIQKDLLDDEDIDMDKERRRCESFEFGFPNTTTTKRRRLFLGGLVADDSMEVMRAVGLEAYNIFHTVSFVESNRTQNLSPRKWRYIPSERHKLYQLFGPKTKVSVDYYVTSRKSDEAIRSHNNYATILHEKLQKEGIVVRWKMNGMRPDDVAIIVDADEMFTRDFLRALQICDVPQLRSDQSCFKPKIIASALVFESSPECITKKRRSHHPDAILGECIDLIGNSTLHPPSMRKWLPDNKEVNITKRIQSSHGSRLRGYGGAKDYSLYELWYGHAGQYPLWSAGDFRDAEGGEMITKQGNFPTAYHFHNWFHNASQIHTKYFTYGHPIHNAMDKPIWELHEDLELGVKCAKGENRDRVDSFDNTPGGVRPIYYLNEEVRKKKHLAWQDIVREEESAFAHLKKNLTDL